ncbi:hypothetical protein ERK18_08030 [Lactobacillus kimbladii]|uniref:hypothetical protein n=1 Tax=Lactobacillus kimbladii TaxID=1218506 RepID=UPI0016504686|nr:hypothetical protein [Lactobacillus kimbladii]MBC6342941.1 hypothetical protein [Lactobacillus kimbladii]
MTGLGYGASDFFSDTEYINNEDTSYQSNRENESLTNDNDTDNIAQNCVYLFIISTIMVTIVRSTDFTCAHKMVAFFIEI